MLWKYCTQYASNFGKLSNGHRTGKGQFSFQSPKKGSAKECSDYHAIAFISHASKVMSKILQARLQQNVNQRSNCQHPLDHQKSKGALGKHILLLYWLCQSLWQCGSPQTVENSSRDGNTIPPDLPPEKSAYRSRSNSNNWTWNYRLVPNQERSKSRLYIVTLLI